MSKFNVAKKVTSHVSSHAAGFATTRLIVANTPTNGGLYEKACVVIGALAVGSLVGAKTQLYVEETFDQIRDSIETAKDAIPAK